MSQNWNFDPVKKDYVLDTKGSPENTDSLSVPAYIRIAARRQQWLYAPDSLWGSDFYLIKKRRSTQDASYFEATAARALQPIVDDGRASSVDATTQVLTRGGIGMQVDVIDARGTPQPSVVIPIEA